MGGQFYQQPESLVLTEPSNKKIAGQKVQTLRVSHRWKIYRIFLQQSLEAVQTTLVDKVAMRRKSPAYIFFNLYKAGMSCFFSFRT